MTPPWMHALYLMLARLPRGVRAANFARRWQAEDLARSAPRNPQDAPGGPNPWRDFLESRTEGAGVQKWMHYADAYERHLSRFAGRQPVVAEVGVASGGSLSLWRHCLGPGCEVHGIDIDPACKALAGPGVSIHLGDQSDRAMWARFRAAVPRVDVFVDDGGHGADQQMTALEEMLPHLHPGGVYICEDVHGDRNRFAGIGHALCDALNAGEIASREGEDWIDATAFQSAIHSIHCYPFMLVIEKRAVPEPRFRAPLRGTAWLPETPA